MPMFLKIFLIVSICLLLGCKPNLSDSDDDDSDDDDEDDDDSDQQCDLDAFCEYQLDGCNFLEWSDLASCRAGYLNDCVGDDQALIECVCRCMVDWPCSEMAGCEEACWNEAGC